MTDKQRVTVVAGQEPSIQQVGEISSLQELEDYASLLEINKASNLDMTESRTRLGEVGYPALHISNDEVFEGKIPELTFPESINTYNKMYMDDSVYKGVSYTKIFLKSALQEFTIIPNRTYIEKEPSKKSKDAADFVDYCLRNINGGSFSVWDNILTYIKNGSSILAKSYTKVNKGKYAGRYKLKKLSPRALRSVYKWEFDKDQEVVGFWQDTGYRDTRNNPHIGEYKEWIPRNKFMLFAYDSTLGNPFGRSKLDSIWQLWKSKRAIANLQNIGIAKNLSGIPVLRIPEDIINKAANDPNGDEAKSIKVLQKNASMFHKGENAYIMLPSNKYTDSNQTYKYDIKLLGVEGGTNNIDLSNIINRIDKAILDAFGCGFVVLGNEGGGSHALASEKTSIFNKLLDEHLKFIEDVINRELIPQLLAINGIFLDEDEMPLFRSGDIADINLDELGKFLQRIAATGLLTGDEDLESFLRGKFKAPRADYTKLLSNYGVEDTSRSGDGLANGLPSGTGNKVGSEGDSSSMNSDNSS